MINALVNKSIHEIQGDALFSPCAGEQVVTRGIVTGHSRKGFFIQAPDTSASAGGSSSGIFVFARKSARNRSFEPGYWVEVRGKVLDYVAQDHDRPCTQIEMRDAQRLERASETIAPHWLDMAVLAGEPAAAADYLNALEGMLVGIRAGATFAAPSNPFGDYVVVPPDWPGVRTRHNGVLVDAQCPERWLPSFRILDYANAPRVDLGARLSSDVIGPLNYRASAYQVACNASISVAPPEPEKPASTRLTPAAGRCTVLTLNTFNLDPHLERAQHVADRERDIDDDVRDLRFAGLAEAIVAAARCPDVIALQEIQDDDGAEQTRTVTASRTLQVLVDEIRKLNGPAYAWAEMSPERDADGGQPGGNIRNAFLFNAERVALVEGSLERMGATSAAFTDSRKPLAATFELKSNGAQLRVINVHLVSKRYQRSIFAPEKPGFDPRLELRIQQAELLADELQRLNRQGVDYYVTGDFNDFEFSETLHALIGGHSANLVDCLPQIERYDYNHRGHCQALTHGVVPARLRSEQRAEYEVMHGNELSGVRPGQLGDRPSDHAYAIARLSLG